MAGWPAGGRTGSRGTLARALFELGFGFGGGSMLSPESKSQNDDKIYTNDFESIT